MPDCQCYTCKNFSRAYLHFLFKEQALAYSNLACIHNIHVMHDVCRKAREYIISFGDTLKN
jgi:queuine tRNA-ribosyltransferase